MAHVRRVLASPTFQSSESLQKLLGYLVEQSLKNPSRPVKEYQIATDVLGRGPEFDSRMDSTVRVSVARLRSKLLEYYATDGKDDPLRIEIPRGSYLIVFHSQNEHHDAHAVNEANGESWRPDEVVSGAGRGWPSGALAAAALAGLAIGAVLAIWSNPYVVGFTRNGPDAAVQRFWSAFTEARESTIVVFSNARFVGDGETGLRYYDPGIDRPEQVKELHTGIGEVIGVHVLDGLFQRLGTAFDVRRAAQVDWEEVKKANIIFLGGPAENMPVRELRYAATFLFESRGDAVSGSRVVIVNRKRANGEAALFDPGIATPMQHDYAIIRLQDGFVPGRNILLLAGITTLGTQAAVEFVCQRDTVEELLSRQQHAENRGQAFECVLDVNINGGVPVGSKIVAFHSLDAN